MSKNESRWSLRNTAKFGYINQDGEAVVPLVYDVVYSERGVWSRSFSEGFAPVSKTSLWSGDAKLGMVDKDGKLVIPIQYDFLFSFQDGLLRAGYNWNYPLYRDWDSICLIDKSGREVISTGGYDRIEYFSEGLARIRRASGDLQGAWGYIDLRGREVVPCVFDETRDFSDGLAAVKTEGKWGYIALPR